MKIMTITGIRPDFIRMSAVFSKLDNNPNIEHILVHTGQHFDEALSLVYFQEFNIRKPNYNLNCGDKGLDHAGQSVLMIPRLLKALRQEKPDWVLFLGDSNSASVAPVVRREGIRVAHIEAGMRSGDWRMLEEINRRVCDHVSDLLFAYTPNNVRNLLDEGHPRNHIVETGNTIVEVVNPYLPKLRAQPSKRNAIYVDIHRPENLNFRDRMTYLTNFGTELRSVTELPVLWLDFPRTRKVMEEFGLDIERHDMQWVPLMNFGDYLQAQYDALCLVSDSGTAQEETPLLGTPVIVPRDFTERPESYLYECSFQLRMDSSWAHIFQWMKNYNPYLGWLGQGNSSSIILEGLLNA